MAMSSSFEGVAMVQVVENRADLEGELLDIRPDPDRPGHKRLTVAVSSVREVESFPNLLGGVRGTRTEIVVPDDQAGALKPGTTVRCRARRAGPMVVYAESCAPTE